MGGYIYTHKHTHTHTNIHTYMGARMPTYIYTEMVVIERRKAWWAHTHKHTNMHSYMGACTHTYIPRWS